MAGGIFKSQPFHPNIKCIIFSFIMIAFYWLSVHFASSKHSHRPNFWMFPLIFIIAYVAMAWYDAYYRCDEDSIMYSGSFGVSATSLFKDQLREKQHKDTVLDQESMYQKNVYLFHVLFVVPILLYVGYQGYKGKISSDWYAVLFVVGVSALVYHGYRLFDPRQTCNIMMDAQGNITSIKKNEA